MKCKGGKLVIIAFLCLFTFVMVFVRQKKYRDAILCPMTIYSIIFISCLTAAYFHIDNRNELSLRRVLYSTFSFFIVILTYSVIERTHVHISYKRCENEVDSSILYFLSILVLLYNIYSFFTGTYQLYKSGTSTADIRGVYLTTNTINSGSLWSLFDGPIFGALRIAVTNIVVIQWFSGKSKDWKLLLINLLSLLIRSFVGSDRLFLFDFVFVFVFGFLLNHKRRRSFEQTKKEMRKKRIFLFVFVGLVIAVILYFTNQRQANSELIDVIYSEFTCGFQIFDIIVDKIDASGIMTFGISTFTGFIVLINLILAYLGFGQIPFVNEINKYDVPFWNIGGGHMNNGYLPYFVPFYLDLREFGIFIGSIFLGFLMARIYKKLKVNNSSYYQSLYLMLILLLVRLTLRFYFTRSDYNMAIVYTIFLYTWKFKIKSKREDVLKNE